MKILLVEDNEHSALFLSKALLSYHYQTETVKDGQTALELIRAFNYDLILLDVMLPGLDGISLCSQLRQEGFQLPIMMITAKDSTSDRVRGLEAGADEYVVKPCELSELIARVRALLRRGREILPIVFAWENLQLDVNTKEVSYEKKRLHLTPKEYGLLELFLRNPGKIFSRNELLNRLWSSSESPGEEAVTTQIKGLRQKLKAAGMTADLIETVYGLGYRLREKNGGVEEQGSKEENSSTLSPISPSSSSTVEVEVLAVVAKAWEDFRESFLRERFGLFELALNNLSTETPDIHLLKQAQAEAHRLAGSLGSYGLPLGSKVAGEIEFLLQTLITWKENAALLLNRLEKLTTDLKKTLQEQPCDEEDKNSYLAKKVFATQKKSAIAKQQKSQLKTPIISNHLSSKKSQEVRIEALASGLEKQKELQVNLAERLELFEKVLSHLSIGVLDSQLLQQAQAEAHHLASSFGNYGLPTGSKVAREAEFLLQTLTNWRQHTALLLNRFEKLTIWLKETLQQQPYIPVSPVIRQLPSTRLLIVDYDTVLTERIKQEAVTNGLQVEVAANLTLAKSIVASRPPNVVLLDINLGNSYENGLNFLAQLTEAKPELPVIVFTTSNQLHYRVEVARLGAYTFLQKNTPVDEVLSKITEVVNQSSVNKAKVMIVDDDPLILHRIKTLLLPWELQVTTLQCPQQFWQILEATTPDLLILDIEMPYFNGIELCQAVRNDSRWSWLPILFLSVHSDEKILHQVYAVGADSYVKKPIVEHELITHIFNRLERNT
ncbi:response regulator [Scytonema hofmannii]|uniref:response regulator n=1 Tax=Scytonema hofmannii TaxID=34078 RepID=UPI00034C42C5|nr:response regulator [Scytonema hofmannii]